MHVRHKYRWSARGMPLAPARLSTLRTRLISQSYLFSDQDLPPFSGAVERVQSDMPGVLLPVMAAESDLIAKATVPSVDPSLYLIVSQCPALRRCFAANE